MKDLIFVLLKGAWIGGTLTVPGVSGGSMAMILGVYERLILSLNSLLKKDSDKKGSLKFLITFCVGAGLGMLALSGIVVALMSAFPTPMVFFFAGAVAGGIPVILTEIDKDKIKICDIIYLAIGVLITVLLTGLPEGLFAISPDMGIRAWPMQLLGGVIAAIALVLPGISVSHMLYVLGIYEGIMASIASLKLLPLIPFGIGALLGVVATSRAIEELLKKCKKQTYLVILGFVAGSVAELLSNINPQEISVICIFLVAAGFAGIFALFHFERKRHE